MRALCLKGSRTQTSAARSYRKILLSFFIGALLLHGPVNQGRASHPKETPVLTPLVAKKNVVVLYDERLALPGLAVIDERLTRTLTSESPDAVEIYREAMDLSRFGSASYLRRLRDYLRAKYADKKIDVVIAAYSGSLDFLLGHGDEIFPGVPIVFFGVDASQIHHPLPRHVTGVLVNREFSPTLDLALYLHPDTKRVVVAAGASDFDARLVDDARSEFRKYEGRVSFEYLTTLSLDELLAKVSRLPPDTIVLYTTLFRDGNGQPFVPHDVAERLSKAANVPVYGFIDQFLGRGIVGGSLYSLATHGKEAARLALRILGGEKPSDLPVAAAKANVVMFDWHQLRRWEIPESWLPSGAAVRFRPRTIWEQYRDYILGAGAVMLAQLILIGGLLYERSRRRSAESRNINLARQLLQVQEEERKRIAADLHDSTQQHLVAIDLQVAHLSKIVAESESAGPPIQQIKNSLRDAQRELRTFTYLLYPPNLREEGLKATVEAFVGGFARRTNLSGEVHIDDKVDDLPYPMQRSTLRVIQEALANVHRHASATRFSVDIDIVDSSLYLHVSDNGRGMSNAPRGKKSPHAGVGIAGMRARVAQLGGQLRIDSGAHGTSVVARIPLSASEPEGGELQLDDSPPLTPDSGQDSPASAQSDAKDSRARSSLSGNY
jgi:signal transduction histidine kinase